MVSLPLYSAHAAYLHHIFEGYDKRQEKISLIIKSIRSFERKYKTPIHYIVVRGVSGITMGSIVAHKMKKGLIVVRKTEKAHSDYNVEGLPCYGNSPYYNGIIVDDCVDSGKTVIEILKSIHKGCEPSYLNEVVIRGVCVYYQNMFICNELSKRQTYCNQTIFTLENIFSYLDHKNGTNLLREYKKWVIQTK